MFYKKRIEELEEKLKREINHLSKVLERDINEIDEKGYIVVESREDCNIGFGNILSMACEKRVSVKYVLEKLLKELGYEINHKYQSESYTLKKTPIPQKKKKK